MGECLVATPRGAVAELRLGNERWGPSLVSPSEISGLWGGEHVETALQTQQVEIVFAPFGFCNSP